MSFLGHSAEFRYTQQRSWMAGWTDMILILPQIPQYQSQPPRMIMSAKRLAECDKSDH